MRNQCIKPAGLISTLGGGLFVASLMLSSYVKAADLYGPPASLKDSPEPFAPAALWPGFYLGGHAGGAWGGPGVSDTFQYVGDPSFNGGLNGTGFIGGAQAGYNIQRGHFVFGPEADIGYLGLSASKLVSFRPNSCTAHYQDGNLSYDLAHHDEQMCWVDGKYSSSSDLYGDITGRFGYALDRTLFYAKGGVAFLDANFKANYSGQNWRTFYGTGGPSLFNFDHSDTLVGWTIGAGVEYALTSSWSLKAEYQHFDFGSLSYSYSGCVSVGEPCPATYQPYNNHFTSTIDGQTKVSVSADAVTLGVNYHINSQAALN